MLVYSHKITPRVRYIFRVMLGDMLGLNVSFTSDKEIFVASEEEKSATPIQRLLMRYILNRRGSYTKQE